MAVRDRVYFDSNVFINTFEARDEVGASVLRLLLSEDPARPTIVTSELTLAEVLVGAYRENDERLIETYEGWMTSNPAIDVAPVNREALVAAALLRADYPSLKLPDAIHVAVAIGTECTKLLTADGKLSGAYRVTNRQYGVTSASAPVTIVRPEAQLINSLASGSL